MNRREFVIGVSGVLACAQLPKLARALTQGQAASVAPDARLPRGFYNFTGSNLVNWKAALAAQRRGEANAIVGCLGDSTVAGQGAANDDLSSDAKSLSWPTQLAKLIPAGSWSSVWGDNNVTANAGDIRNFDARLDGSGWTAAYINASGTLCGGFFQGEPAANSHAFNPTNLIDTIEVWYARSPDNGSFSIHVDGGPALATVNCAGPNAFLKATARCTPGRHSISLQRVAGNEAEVYLTGLRVYNSAVKEVSVYNLGGCRWGSADFVVRTYPWSALPALTAIAPNLVIFQAGQVNDWNGHVALSEVTANMTAVIKALKAVRCDVILMSSVPSKATYFPSYDEQESYVTNMKSLAYALDVPFIDIWTLFGGSWNAGAMFDSLHPNQTGYELIAGYAKAAIMDPAARSAS